MKRQDKSDSDDLRRKTEKLLKNKPLETGSYLSETETLRLVHELQVHLIEQEIQNEELRMAKEEAEVDSQKYSA